MTDWRITKGAHKGPKGRSGCAAEVRFLLCGCGRCLRLRANGVSITDHPPCTPPSIARAVPAVNDRLAIRQRLLARLPLIPSIDEDADPVVVARVDRRVALWGARQVEHLADTPAVAACNEATGLYIAGELTRRSLRRAARLAERRSYQGRWDSASRSARAAAGAAATGRPTACSLAFSEAAAAAAHELTGEELLAWFDDLLDLYVKVSADEGLLASMSWLTEGAAS